MVISMLIGEQKQLEILKSTGNTYRLLPFPHPHARVSAYVHRMKIPSMRTSSPFRRVARSHASSCVRLRFVPLSIHGELASR